MKDIKLLISSILIIVAFFVGLMYERQNQSESIEEALSEKHFVEIKKKSSKLDITVNDENTFIIFDWEKVQSGSISFEIE